MKRKHFVCVPCRKDMKAAYEAKCPHCGNVATDLGYLGYRWRAPRLTNEAAWRKIEAGDFLWDKSKKSRHAPLISWEEEHPNANRKNYKSTLRGYLLSYHERKKLGLDKP